MFVPSRPSIANFQHAVRPVCPMGEAVEAIPTRAEPWHDEVILLSNGGEERAAQPTHPTSHGGIERCLIRRSHPGAIEGDRVRHPRFDHEEDDIPGTDGDVIRFESIPPRRAIAGEGHREARLGLEPTASDSYQDGEAEGDGQRGEPTSHGMHAPGRGPAGLVSER